MKSKWFEWALPELWQRYLLVEQEARDDKLACTSFYYRTNSQQFLQTIERARLSNCCNRVGRPAELPTPELCEQVTVPTLHWVLRFEIWRPAPTTTMAALKFVRSVWSFKVCQAKC